MGISVSETLPSDLSHYTCIVDAVFGFSFSGEIRAPFGVVIDALKETQTPIASIDVPSGRCQTLNSSNLIIKSFYSSALKDFRSAGTSQS